jgi:phosphomannomutase
MPAMGSSEIEQLLSRAEEWRSQDPDPGTVAELGKLIADRDETELKDRFAGRLAFGTAGLRGLIGAGPNRMNRAVVRQTTAGLARHLLDVGSDARERGVVVARDGRLMSDVFAEDVAGVLAAFGIPALVLEGTAPTPLAAFAVRDQGACAAAMVTASHNPPEYNGYKVYWENGAQIVPPHDAAIAAAIEAAGRADRIPVVDLEDARRRGLIRSLGEDVGRRYLDGLLGLRRQPGLGADLGIVYSAMHGVGGSWVVSALREAGFSRVFPVPEQQEPDGTFPTVRFPNPEEPGAMDLALGLAEREGADLVLANDPDADRLAAVARDADGTLRSVSGNEIGVLLGHYCLTQGDVPERPLVLTTIVSSQQLGVIARDLGARYDETLTGFRWVWNRALELEQAEGVRYVFGYEEALGYSVGRLARDKDGIGAALVFAEVAAWCRSQGRTVFGYLEEIQRCHGLFLAAQRNHTFPGLSGAGTISGIMEGFRERSPGEIGGLAVVSLKDYGRRVHRRSDGELPLTLPKSNVLAYELEDGSRVTLRPSGTEPKIKYYFEVREPIQGDEPVTRARERGGARLDRIVSAFEALARERGQPE